MTFSEWLNQQDIELCKWEYVEPVGCTPHDHVLVPYTPEETDIIIERYLRNVRKIYGDMPAAGIICAYLTALILIRRYQKRQRK